MNENELDRLYGGNTLLKITMESACDLTGGDSSTEAAGRVGRDKQSLLRVVVQRAKSFGTWIEIEPLIGEMIGNGQENDVFLTSDEILIVEVVDTHGMTNLGDGLYVPIVGSV